MNLKRIERSFFWFVIFLLSIAGLLWFSLVVKLMDYAGYGDHGLRMLEGEIKK